MVRAFYYSVVQLLSRRWKIGSNTWIHWYDWSIKLGY